MTARSTKILKFESSNCVSFANGLHTQFQRKQYELIKAEDAQKLNLSAELIKEWKNAIDLEVEIGKQALASVHTAKLKHKDRERDKLLVYLLALIRAQRKSPVESVSKAAERLYIVLKPYTGIQRESMEVKSGHIVGLLVDVAKYTAEQTELSIDSTISQLRVVNEEYEKMRTDRRVEQVLTKLPDVRIVRHDADEAFKTVCHYIEASYLLAKTAEEQAPIQKLVERINKISTDFKTTYKLTQAQAGTEAEKPGKKKPKHRKRETEAEKIARMLPAFEKKYDFPSGSLSFTGITKDIDGMHLCKLISTDPAKEPVWVVIRPKHLKWIGYTEPEKLG